MRHLSITAALALLALSACVTMPQRRANILSAQRRVDAKCAKGPIGLAKLLGRAHCFASSDPMPATCEASGSDARPESVVWANDQIQQADEMTNAVNSGVAWTGFWNSSLNR